MSKLRFCHMDIYKCLYCIFIYYLRLQIKKIAKKKRVFFFVALLCE